MEHVGLLVNEGVSSGISPFNEASKRNIGLIMSRKRGVPNVPIMISSLQEDYVAFGGVQDGQYGAYITRNLFNNAGIFGAVYYGVRIVGAGSATASVTVETVSASPETVATFKAGRLGQEDPGIWGNDLVVKLTPPDDPLGLPELILAEVYLASTLVESFQAETWETLVNLVNAQSLYIMAEAGDAGVAASALTTTTFATLTGGVTVEPEEEDFYATADPITPLGLSCFDGIDIQLLACTQYQTLTMVQEAAIYCSSRADCIYITNLPYLSSTATVESWASALQSNLTSFVAPYNFWVKTSKDSGTIWVPSIGVILGAGYIRVPELSRGYVWIPPGGIDSAFTDVIDIAPTNLSPAVINLWVKRYSTNVAVFRPGIGFFLYSSRTYSTNSLYQSVHIRRLTNFLVKTVDANSLFTLQKPSTPELKQEIILALTMYFKGIYDQGGLERSIPFSEACIITSDKTNNPATQDRKALNVDVEYIPTECTESVTIRLSRNDGQLIVKSLEN